MQKPVQITFRDIEPTDAVSQVVHDKAAKLERTFDRISECHVVISAPHHHQQGGRIYHVKLHVHVPGKELVVDHESGQEEHRDVYVAIRDAFEAARRQLASYAEQLRHDRRHG